MTSGNKMEDEWKESIEICLRQIGTYKCVKAIRMVGVYLLVYCRGKLYSNISEVDSDSVATGVLGIIVSSRLSHARLC